MTNSAALKIENTETSALMQHAPTVVGCLDQHSLTPWLNAFRHEGLEQLQSMSWPSRKNEHWKYTSLATLSAERFDGEVNPIKGAVDAAAVLVEGLDGLRVVFVDGIYNDSLSTLKSTPSFVCQRFAEADELQQQFIKEQLGKVVDSKGHFFAAHNNALVQDGVLLRIGKDTNITDPIQIVHITTQQHKPCLTIARLLVVVEGNAQATVIERYVSNGVAQSGFVNALSECIVGPNAQLTHYGIHLEDESARHVGGLHVNLLRDSRFHGFQMGLGSMLKRIDIAVNHCEQGASCELNGVYLPKHSQHIDFHTDIQHRAAHCTTSEVFRGIVADKAKATFNGRIYIHPNAQKTLAELSNKNLLLSNQAEINTKPELEIYADDVKCAHGATVSQLDNGAVSYLRSRGIGMQKAELMMSVGFINELIEAIELEPMKQLLKQVIASWFVQES